MRVTTGIIPRTAHHAEGWSHRVRLCVSADLGYLGCAEGSDLQSRVGAGMNDESLNLREAIRQAREKVNREWNQAKCKRY
jgi:hypothetical protein